MALERDLVSWGPPPAWPWGAWSSGGPLLHGTGGGGSGQLGAPPTWYWEAGVGDKEMKMRQRKGQGTPVCIPEDMGPCCPDPGLYSGISLQLGVSGSSQK